MGPKGTAGLKWVRAAETGLEKPGTQGEAGKMTRRLGH